MTNIVLSPCWSQAACRKKKSQAHKQYHNGVVSNSIFIFWSSSNTWMENDKPTQMLTLMAVWLCSHTPEAAQGAHHLHPHTAGHPGGAVLQDPLPRHLHEGGGGPQDQPAWVTCAGTGEVGCSRDGGHIVQWRLLGTFSETWHKNFKGNPLLLPREDNSIFILCPA